MQNRGVERGLRGAKGNGYEENIISAVSTTRQRPICARICAADQVGNSSAKDVIGRQKENATQEKFLEANARKVAPSC